MNLKMKRRTKIVSLSVMLICLFAISFGSTVSAAKDPPIMSLVYEDRMETWQLPIKVVFNFEWESGSWQTLLYVYIDWGINKDITEGLYRVEATFRKEYTVKRPRELTLIIPAEGEKYENGSVYFKVIYGWCAYIGGEEIEEPSKVHEVKIYYEGGVAEEEKDDLILYIILGAAGAVVLIALAVIFTIRRRR